MRVSAPFCDHALGCYTLDIRLLTYCSIFIIFYQSMNNSIANKDVFISGKSVITDWRQAKVISPDNLQGKIKANKTAKEEIERQKEIAPTSNNTATKLV